MDHINIYYSVNRCCSPYSYNVPAQRKCQQEWGNYPVYLSNRKLCVVLGKVIYIICSQLFTIFYTIIAINVAKHPAQILSA